MNTQNYTVINALTDIIAAPVRALTEVKERTSWLWWPLLISIALPIVGNLYYVNWVDFEWLVNETIRTLPPDSPPESAQAVRDFMSPQQSMIFGVIGIVVIVFLVYVIQAAYLHLANKVSTGAEIRFGQWFAFSAWTAFPGIFNAIAMFVVIFTAASNQLGQDSLIPLSINSLIIGAEPGEPWFTWGNSLTVVNFWMLGLMSIGYRIWTGASMVASTIIACLPWALIFGIWAALI
ncbi:MAG: YIP1 family protein [Pseudomonadota bacterium]